MAGAGQSIKQWTFYHVEIEWGSLYDSLARNLQSEDALLRFLCPFIEGEIYPSSGDGVVNPRAFRSLTVYGSDRPIDSEWPPIEGKDRSDIAISKYLKEHGHNCSPDAFNAAVILIESGAYKASRQSLMESFQQNFVFAISSIGEPEVDRLYYSVVKPCVTRYGFEMVRADEIRHTELITSTIYESISKSRFIICDLTRAKPNCYYELGYAHALAKPCILLAQEGTERQFDVAGYRWNYWRSDQNFGPAFEAELKGVLARLNQPEPRTKRGS